ncbi:MAG TPA: choice-of-anchor Q domain-containing protein, partial [Solirubrobacterales bacterium]
PNPGPCLPADCSLREALTASNNSVAVDDVVILPAAAAPYLIQDESFTLPIVDEVEIRGAGAEETVVKGNPEGVAFTIGGFKTTLVGLTITGGKGAIENNGALTIRGVSIEHNERDITAGGISSGGPVTIESSFLGFNRTKTATGGAIHSNGPVTIVNSTVAHNSSEKGPAAIGVNSLLTIRSSAVVSNRSEAMGSAGAAAIELTVQDSIFADNRNATGLRNCSSGTPTSLGGNVSDDATCGAGATDKPNVNPLLGTLALHGGTTQLYDLLAGSPAIDAASQCPALDQRGAARPQGAACDSGPYEVEVAPAPRLPASAPRDGALAIGLGKGRLSLNRKNRIHIRLTCPADEASPPCAGKVELRSPWLRSYVGGLRDSRPSVKYPAARFVIAAGKTKDIAIRLPKLAAEFLRDFPKPRKVRVVVTAADAAGNSQRVRAPRKLAPAPPR